MSTSEEPTTHLSTGREATSRPMVPLTDDEILRDYGPLLWEFYRHIASDPSYATEMVEAANGVDRYKVIAARRVARRGR